MSAGVVVASMAMVLTGLFAWAFRVLPREEWQMLAALPRRRDLDGSWHGTNLTYYGVFNALGMAVAVAVAVFLAGAGGVPPPHLAVSVAGTLAICLPAAKLLNRVVEGHWHGFTVGGAAFVGMMAAPWVVRGAADLVAPGGTALPVLAALAAAYAIGEGIGRLACISFGCCYGRPLSDSPAWQRRVFGSGAFVFDGWLKKASYAHGLDGRRLIPVQGMTAVISSLAGLAGIALFLNGRLRLAYLLPVAITQVWRFLSEFLRADYRGGGRITAYQGMALAGAACTAPVALLWPVGPVSTPEVARGWAALWTPGTILFIEAIAVIVFLRMGISTVTTSRLTFGLARERAGTRPEAIPSHAPRDRDPARAASGDRLSAQLSDNTPIVR